MDLPGWTAQRREVINEEVSLRGGLPSQQTTDRRTTRIAYKEQTSLKGVYVKSIAKHFASDRSRGQSSWVPDGGQSLRPLNESREKTTQFHGLALIQAGPGN